MSSVDWYPVIRLPLEQDLAPFLTHLDTLGIRHYVTEEEGQQQLWINDESKRLDVANKLAEWLSGNTVYSDSLSDTVKPERSGMNLLQVLFSLAYIVPVTLSAIVLGFIGYLLVFLDSQSFSYAWPFLFQAFSQAGGLHSLAETLAKGDYWRLLTPIFLHFSLLHIIFNGLILWIFGQKIEVAKGSLHIALVIVIVGISSNVAQYMAQAGTVFGGLSGVGYGLIGYIGVYQHYIPHPILQFNKAAIAFFIVWLLLGVFGIIDVFISGSIANTAHVVGLISGALIGFVEAFRDKTKISQ